MRRDRRVGFTLLEVVVALLVSGVVVLGARLLLERIGDGAQRIVATASASDERANGIRLLRDLTLRLDPGTTDATPFSGDSAVTRFGTWCEVPRGWIERCVVLIAVRRGEARDTISVATSTGLAFAAFDGPAPLELRYLRSARDGGEWFRTWGSGVTAPLAIGIVSPRDTTILRIGDRG
ncbi:MAG TPA: prepilin-type N-terminal cleavage/methylation domain-containing protein [Gemmatimonadaceae bacterium]|nr:prepilin-type N-terminal cleavage/methylation domain-containing protein [Gemmatimonadaceae bacterium]